MPPFSREKSARRDIIITLRVSAEEAAALDALARRLSLPTRAEVLRAGLDALSAKAPVKGRS